MNATGIALNSAGHLVIGNRQRTVFINVQRARIADDVGLIGNKVCLCCGQ